LHRREIVHYGRGESKNKEKETDWIKNEWKESEEKKKTVIGKKEKGWKKNRRLKFGKWKSSDRKRNGTDKQLRM
jgi:hypothetical protein